MDIPFEAAWQLSTPPPRTPRGRSQPAADRLCHHGPPLLHLQGRRPPLPHLLEDSSRPGLRTEAKIHH